MRRTGSTKRYRFRSTRQQSSKPGPLRGSWLFFVPKPLPRECSRGLGADAALNVRPPHQTVSMVGIGKSEQVLAGAPRAATARGLHAAAFAGAVPAAVLVALPHDAGNYGADFPFDEFEDGGLASDDDLDAAFPASFPEDPFPEALFADRPRDDSLLDDSPFDDDAFHDCDFHDGVPSSAAASGHTPGSSWAEDRATTSGWFLPAADPTADNAGLIDQIRAYEDVKCWAAGQQARLAVTFEARHRQEQARATGRRGPGQGPRERQGHGRGGTDRPGPAGVTHRGGRLLGLAKALVRKCRTPWPPWIPGS